MQTLAETLLPRRREEPGRRGQILRTADLILWVLDRWSRGPIVPDRAGRCLRRKGDDIGQRSFLQPEAVWSDQDELCDALGGERGHLGRDHAAQAVADHMRRV